MNKKINSLACWLVIVCNCFLSSPSFSQKYANYWAFGFYNGLDFNSPNGPVMAPSGIDSSSTEGCASICDKTTGQLLFYTNGTTLWDRTHHPMPNGTSLHGNVSASQAGLFVPWPGKDSLYYLFTPDAEGGALYYSVVDLSLNGGLGDVTVKNQLLAPNTGEKVTGIKHCNGTDFWVISHAMNFNLFCAYLITESGIDSKSPVYSAVGAIANDAHGYLKVSPNGKKLALVNTYDGILEIDDFNTSTGIISNPIIDNFVDGYGLAFSPNSKLLYVASFDGTGINQYDLSSGDSATIISSNIYITAVSNTLGLQLAPDGKIYIVEGYNTYLGCINKPNVPGLGCNFIDHAVDITNNSTYGLPNYIESFFNQVNIGRDTAICSGQPITLHVNNTNATYLWSTGETTASITASSGTYEVEIKEGNCVTQTGLINIVKEIDLGENISLCEGEDYVVNVTTVKSNLSPNYLWSTGETASTITISKPGTYSVKVKTGNCLFSDEVTVGGSVTDVSKIIPNVFTPNADGKNDLLDFSAASLAEFHFKLYNRWGELAYQSNDAAEKWNGQSNAKDIQEGTYFWILDYQSSCAPDKALLSKKGTMTILR